MNFKDYTINELRHLLADNNIDFARTDDKADLIRLVDKAFSSNKLKNTAYIDKATARLKKEGKYVASSASKTAKKATSTASNTAKNLNDQTSKHSGLPKWLLPVAGVAVAGLAGWYLLTQTGVIGGTGNLVKDSAGKIIGLGANVSGSLKNLLGDEGSAIAGIASNATKLDDAKNNASQLLSSVDNLPDNIKNASGVKGAIDKLNDAVKNSKLADVNAAIAGLQSSVADAAKSAKSDVADAITKISVDADNIDDAKDNAKEAVKQFDLLPAGIKNNSKVSDAKAELDQAAASGDYKRINAALKNFQAAVKKATDEGQQAITLIANVPSDADSIEEIHSNAKVALDQYNNLPDKVKDDKEVEKTQKALKEANQDDDKAKVNQAIADFKAAVANAAEKADAEKTEGSINQDDRQDGVYYDGPFQGGDGANTNAKNFAGQHVTILDRAIGYQGHTYAQVRTDAGVTFWMDKDGIK